MNVFPEYQNRSLRSLLWELVQVAPDQEKEEIRRAYRQSLQLQYIYSQGLYGSKQLPNQPRAPLAHTLHAIADSVVATKEFVSVFNLKRWGSPFEERLRKDRGDKATAVGPNSK